jgi:hypothetical protein
MLAAMRRASSLLSRARELGCVMIALKISSELPHGIGVLDQCQHADDQARAARSRISTSICAPSSAPETRMKLRRKLRACACAAAGYLGGKTGCERNGQRNYPLYLNVLARSPLQFEKLTKQFLAEISARMPDKSRFLVWRQEGARGRVCLMHGGQRDIYHEYVGFDYSVAFKLHLYYRVFHEVEWAIRQRLPGVSQRQPQLRSEMASALIARSNRSLRPPHLAADQRRAPAPAAAARANARRSDPAELEKSRPVGVIRSQ